MLNLVIADPFQFLGGLSRVGEIHLAADGPEVVVHHLFKPEAVVGLCKGGKLGVPGRQDRFGNGPADSDLWVVPDDAPI